MSKIIHVNIDDILSGWQSSCSYKAPDGDCIDECSVGRIARWGAHYIAIIHDDVPEDERKELAEFIANAPKKIEKLEAKITKLQDEKERLLVLAMKHCPTAHRDFLELISIANDMEK